MANVLKLTRDDPVIHLKAYGGVQIRGVDRAEVSCEIDAPQLATLVEDDGHVYVTVNATCQLEVPVKSSIIVERGMGSVLIEQIANLITVEKVLGNLVLVNVGQATVGKVGGNFSVRNAAGNIQVDKIAGSLTVDQAQSIQCAKVGGNCVLRDIHADALVEKAGGTCLVQGVAGGAALLKFGGSLKARDISLKEDVKVGGNIELVGCKLSTNLDLSAGGNIALALSQDQLDYTLHIESGGKNIKIQAQGEDFKIQDYEHAHTFGDGSRTIRLSAGGSVSIADAPAPGEDLIGDISDRFTFEESAFSALIQERIDSATRRAEAKVRAAEIRLGQIQDRVEKFRGIKVDVDFGDKDGRDVPRPPVQPVPPVSRPAGKKGATDEERLMILKMLQDGTITVDEAESLFRAMES